MSSYSEKRASRLRRFKDADDEYIETRSKRAAIERDIGMREGTSRDFLYAREHLHGRVIDDYKRRRELVRQLGFDKFSKKENT